jgi:hypothetical protein
MFGYEGGGQDYHLALVDPKSKDIKIYLPGFSGAGVGSASDAGFATLLSSQANDAFTRLVEQTGKILQQTRGESLLGTDH